MTRIHICNEAIERLKERQVTARLLHYAVQIRRNSLLTDLYQFHVFNVLTIASNYLGRLIRRQMQKMIDGKVFHFFQHVQNVYIAVVVSKSVSS